MTVERVRVGDVLQLVRRAVTVDPIAAYELVGAYSFGKGLFRREAKPGSELGDYKFFAIEPGDLVLSNIQAWEGAIALAGKEHAGLIGTHRFLSYVPRDDRIDTSWARWFFLSEPGMELIRRAAPGTAVRNRTLSIERFEALEIPLPPINQQRSAVDRLDRIDEAAGLLARQIGVSSSLLLALAHSSSASVVENGTNSGWPMRPLADVAEINPKPDHLNPKDQVMFVPMSAVDADSGTIAMGSQRRAGEIGQGYKQFRCGDVIFARITPCMQNGKCAIFDGENTYGYGSTEFHVIRPGAQITAEWLHHMMRMKEFRDKAAERFTGTAGQQRVPSDFLKTALIPIPDIETQAHAVAALVRIDNASRALKANRLRSNRLLAALGSSALNKFLVAVS